MATERTYRRRVGALAAMLAANPRRHRQSTWGAVEPVNECGTVACVAGWAALWSRRVVKIAPDGTLAWDPARQRVDRDLHPLAPTLWRDSYSDDAWDRGREWLGLGYEAAHLLFLSINKTSDPNAAALEVLRRLADGRLPLDFTRDDVEDLIYA
jgi:hypothetical protein